MRLRCRGRGVVFIVRSAQPRLRVELEPQQADRSDGVEEKSRNVFSSHQRAFISMYNPMNQSAIAPPPFMNAHGNVNVPPTRRSSIANVNQRTPTSKHPSVTRPWMWRTSVFVYLISHEATSAFAHAVKS